MTPEALMRRRVPEILDAEHGDFDQISRAEPVLCVGFP